MTMAHKVTLVTVGKDLRRRPGSLRDILFKLLSFILPLSMTGLRAGAAFKAKWNSRVVA